MERKLIKEFIVPDSVKKQIKTLVSLELYNDCLIAKYISMDRMFLFSHYMDVSRTYASIFTQFAHLVFITPENSSNYYCGSNLQDLADMNKIAFCSGMFSYATANKYVDSLLLEIRTVMNEYKSIVSQNVGSTTATQKTSEADEIKKYKELLDEGIITKEEFDRKKKQILGL